MEYVVGGGDFDFLILVNRRIKDTHLSFFSFGFSELLTPVTEVVDGCEAIALAILKVLFGLRFISVTAEEVAEAVALLFVPTIVVAEVNDGCKVACFPGEEMFEDITALWLRPSGFTGFCSLCRGGLVS